MNEATDRTRWTGGLLNRHEGRVLLSCAAVGVIFAIGLGLLSGSGYTATSLADGGPGGSVDAALDVSPDVANRYVQTELVYIGILEPEFNQALEAAGLPAGPVRATQEGATNVIRLSAAGVDPNRAAAAANVVLATYIADWKERTTADLERLLVNTEDRIVEVRSESEGLGDTAEDVAQRRGLLTELSRLTQERSDLQFRIGGVKAANRVVEQATPGEAERSTSWFQMVLLGLIAGTAAALGYIVLRRARRVAQRAPED